MKAEARALKAAAELSEMESGEDSGVDRATMLGEDEAPFSAMLCRARD